MPKFMIAYQGMKQPASPEEGKAMQAKWFEWVKAQGTAMLEPGNPLGKSMTVTIEGVRETNAELPFVGYSVVEAADLDAALEIAKACPHLMIGQVEVAEIKSMGN